MAAAPVPVTQNLGNGMVPNPYTVPAGKHLVATFLFQGAATLNVNGQSATNYAATQPTKGHVFISGTVLAGAGDAGARVHVTGFLYDN